MRKPRRDKYTTLYIDRHGKERCRFRKDGFSCSLPHPSDPAYRTAYRKALEGSVPIKPRSAPGSVDAVIASFYRSIKFNKGGEEWRKTVRQTLEPFREKFGAQLIVHFQVRHIEGILTQRMEKRVQDGRITGGLSAAQRLREQLERLFDHAIKLELIRTNPVKLVDDLPRIKGGYHSWTEEEIAAFQDRHALGSKARLALEIMLWTALRRGDAIRLGPQHLKGGRITMTAGKTGKKVDLLAAPALLAAIDAMPAVGMTTFLVTEYGRPFTVAGFGNWFRDRCNEAGLPHCTAHGLRKALARRAADLGATQQQLKAVGQWSGDREVATYTAGAEQRGLADAALGKVIEWAGRE